MIARNFCQLLNLDRVRDSTESIPHRNEELRVATEVSLAGSFKLISSHFISHQSLTRRYLFIAEYADADFHSPPNPSPSCMRTLPSNHNTEKIVSSATVWSTFRSELRACLVIILNCQRQGDEFLFKTFLLINASHSNKCRNSSSIIV